MSILLHVIKYHMDKDVVEHISKKGCISYQISSVANSLEWFTRDHIAMIYSILFDCMKISIPVSGSVLLEEFEQVING